MEQGGSDAAQMGYAGSAVPRADSAGPRAGGPPTPSLVLLKSTDGEGLVGGVQKVWEGLKFLFGLEGGDGGSGSFSLAARLFLMPHYR